MSELNGSNGCKKGKHRGLGKNRFHIIPKSKGGNGSENIVRDICVGCHKEYHALFNAMTPDEIIEYLVESFWGGQKEWVVKYLSELGVSKSTLAIVSRQTGANTTRVMVI